MHQNVGSSYLSVVLLMYFILFIRLLLNSLGLLIFFQKADIILIVTRLTSSNFIYVSFFNHVANFSHYHTLYYTVCLQPKFQSNFLVYERLRRGSISYQRPFLLGFLGTSRKTQHHPFSETDFNS